MAERGQLFAQEEASEQDDFSDLATRRALRDLYEAKEMGMSTLDALGEQGESIDRMQFAADRMHGALDESEKKLREMESGFGFFRKKDRAKSRAARSKAASPFDTDFDVCGTLLKKANHLKDWRRRWFFLVENRLLYWKAQAEADKGRSPRGYIDLTNAHIRLTSREASGRDYSFEIGTKERTYQFAAEGQRACRAWYTSLSQHMILFGGSTDMEGVVAAGAAQGVHRRAHEGGSAHGSGSGGAAAASAAGGAGSAQPGMAHLISEDNVPLKARATEMDKDLREISVVTGDLDGLARTMGAEIDCQNEALGRLAGDVEEVDTRMAQQARRVRRLDH